MAKELSEVFSIVGSKLIVKEIIPKTTSRSGLESGKSSVKSESKGNVMLVSNSLSELYELGDEIYYPKFAGVEVSAYGEDYKILQDNEIFFKRKDGELIAMSDYIIVLKNDKKTSSDTGVLYSKSSSKERTSGEVISKSDKVNPQIEIGNQVVFSKHSGVELTVDGKQIVVIQEGEILVILK